MDSTKQETEKLDVHSLHELRMIENCRYNIIIGVFILLPIFIWPAVHFHGDGRDIFKGILIFILLGIFSDLREIRQRKRNLVQINQEKQTFDNYSKEEL